MNKIKHTSGGYAGLFLLIITLAVIIYLLMLEFGAFTKKDEDGQTKIQQDLQAIDDAKEIKNIIEQRNSEDFSD